MQAEQLRRTLEAGDFDTAERMALEYGASVVAAPQPAALRQALETLNDCLHLTRVLRAHLAAQVRANSPAIEYQPATTENRHWQFEA